MPAPMPSRPVEDAGHSGPASSSAPATPPGPRGCRPLRPGHEDAGHSAGRSLENQRELLGGQANATRALGELHGFLSRALEESREAVQRLARFGRQQQEELLSRQEQLQRAHDHLMHNSESIHRTQEEFSAKQAGIFAALDKL